MKDSEILNNDLEAGLNYQLTANREELIALDIKYPEVQETKERLLAFDVAAYQEHVFDLLKNKLIGEWVKYQNQRDIATFDMMYFEYHEQNEDQTEAYSYAISGLKNYDAYNGEYEMGYNYQMLWEAGVGVSLEPFAITDPMSYGKLGEDRHELIAVEDSDSGKDQIWNLIISICEYAFHHAFSKADQQGLFKNLHLKEDGAFVFTMHDNGSNHRPFYVKR